MSNKAQSKERNRVTYNGTMLEQHEEFWFSDGNLVLVAHDTAFRIYRGLLTVQSQVFESMFMSASSISDECLDGCPVVHLSDSPEDLAHLLHVLLPTSRKIFYLRRGEPQIHFEEVFAVVVLAHKYGIEDIEAQALSFLQDTGYFSSKLDRFQKPDTKKPPTKPAQAIGAVILARLTNTPSMLPGALYRCCALSGRLLDGWARADGTAWHLAPEDAKRCVAARATLPHIEWRTFYLIFDDKLVSCARPDECRAGLRLLRTTILQRKAMERLTLWDWSSDLSQGLVDHRICDRCHQVFQELNNHMLQVVWERLPEIFGLDVEGWSTT